MRVRRLRVDTGFQSLPIAPAESRQLSLEARGLLWYLLTRPDGWDLHIEALRGDLAYERDGEWKPPGRNKLYSLLAELRRLGYVRRVQVRDEHGKMNGCEYHIYDLPQLEIPEDCPDEPTATEQQRAETLEGGDGEDVAQFFGGPADDDPPQHAQGEHGGLSDGLNLIIGTGRATSLTAAEQLATGVYTNAFLERVAHADAQRFAEYVCEVIDDGGGSFEQIEKQWYDFLEEARNSGQKQYITPRNAVTRFDDWRHSPKNRARAVNDRFGRYYRSDETGKPRLRLWSDLLDAGLVTDTADPANPHTWPAELRKAREALQ